MNPILRIRRDILRVSQVEMGLIAGGASQATVSRWENGELEPNLSQIALIRAEIKRRRLRWKDIWFFEVPSAPQRAA
jgi:predicted transcriptional regulator